MKNNGYTILETFVGAGGSHLGFMQENFRTLYVNDFIKECLETLKYNNSNLIEENTYFDTTPIENINLDDLQKKLKIKTSAIDVIFGGVVCKGFSLAGGRSPNDVRNMLYRKQLNFINQFKPKISIMENVPGILNSKILKHDAPQDVKDDVDRIWKKLANFKGKKANLRKINGLTKEFEQYGHELKKEKDREIAYLEKNNYLVGVIDDMRSIYKKMGYTLSYRVLNASWYGAATRRERAIIVAVRNDLKEKFEFPKPKYMSKQVYKNYLPKEFLKLPNPRTVGDALNTIDYSNKDDIDNQPMKHKPKTVERFKFIPEGDSIANHMDELPEELKISKFYSRGSTMRLSRYEPSPTLVPGHSNFPVHPTKNRSITVREAAAITGFPNDYKFFGSHSKRCEHVGNAVPPALGRAIAKQCIKLLDSYYCKK